MCVRDCELREACETPRWSPPASVRYDAMGRVESRAICCFYDLEDRMYIIIQSLVHPASPSLAYHPPLSSLFAPVHSPSEGPPSPKSTGSPRIRVGDTSPIRARPLLIFVLDGEWSSILFATVVLTLLSSFHLGIFARARKFTCNNEKAARRGAGREIVSEAHEPLPLKYCSGFLRARQRIAIPAYTQACLIDLLDLCFCGIP